MHTAVVHLNTTFATEFPTIRVRHGVPQVPPRPNLEPFNNPMLWPAFRKNLVLFTSFFAIFSTAYDVGVSYSAGLSATEPIPTTAPRDVGLVTLACGFSSNPIILAPILDINNRFPILAICSIFYLMFQIISRSTTEFYAQIAMSFILSIYGSTLITMTISIVVDVWPGRQANLLAAFLCCAVPFGAAAGTLTSMFPQPDTISTGFFTTSNYYSFRCKRRLC